MPANVWVYTFAFLGVTFSFQAYMFSTFLFLWVLYGALVPLDVWTRIRIVKKTNTSTRSNVMRCGIAEKSQILLIMMFLAIGAYFMSGVLNTTCGIMCMSIGTIISMFMGLFVITEFSSVLENQIEYAAITNTKPNPVVVILSKVMGIVYTNLSKKLDEKVNSLNDKK